MKKLFVLLLIITLTGCSAFREKGQPYVGYSCRDSLIHFYSQCLQERLSKEDFDAKVRECEKDFLGGICEREQADVLWCMGRVAPGTYLNVSSACIGWACFGSGSASDGCDCSSFIGALRECRMKITHAPTQFPVITANHNKSECKPAALPWMGKAVANAESKNWSEAMRTASAAINIDPDCPGAYAVRSWVYLELGLHEKALADAQKALSLDPSNVAALNNRGLFYLRNGDPQRAKGDFEKACTGGLEVGCNNFSLVSGYRPSEKVNFYLKKTDEAFNKKDWDRVIELASEIPDDALALSTRCGAYAYKGMLIEAINDCDNSIKINPELSVSYNNKGFAMELMGNKKEALINYEIACNLGLPLACDNLKKLRGMN